MTRSTLFDRLNQELSVFGKKAQAALDEGKLQIELLRYRRKQDNAARDLGLLIHRRERGHEIQPPGSTRSSCGWTISRRRSGASRVRSRRPAGSAHRRRRPRRRSSRSRRLPPEDQVRDTSSIRVAMATRMRSG